MLALRNLLSFSLQLHESGSALKPGGLLTILFTLQEGTISRQWLGEFRSVALTPRESKAKPGTGLGLLSIFQSTLHTDTEHAYNVIQTPFALEISTHGPFGDAHDKPTSTRARVLATRDYLLHGLAPMGEIEFRLRAAGKTNPGLSYMFSPKYSEKQITATKARATEAGFTATDERAYADGFYALIQFSQLAFRTEGIDAIMEEIADTPSPFSNTFVNLDWNEITLEDGIAWGLPGTRVFRVPYNLYSKTRAKGAFFVTAPRPPLMNVAGIIGLTVDETSKAAGRRMTMRVLAGRKAPQ